MSSSKRIGVIGDGLSGASKAEVQQNDDVQGTTSAVFEETGHDGLKSLTPLTDTKYLWPSPSPPQPTCVGKPTNPNTSNPIRGLEQCEASYANNTGDYPQAVRIGLQSAAVNDLLCQPASPLSHTGPYTNGARRWNPSMYGVEPVTHSFDRGNYADTFGFRVPGNIRTNTTSSSYKHFHTRRKLDTHSRTSSDEFYPGAYYEVNKAEPSTPRVYATAVVGDEEVTESFRSDNEQPYQIGDNDDAKFSVSDFEQLHLMDSRTGQSFVNGFHSARQQPSPNGRMTSKFSGYVNSGIPVHMSSTVACSLTSQLPHFVFPARPPFHSSSANYGGDPTLPSNQSANIPEWQSCSLWITNLNLPADESAYRQLLFAIRGCGKVYACVINRPDKSKGHMTCAAKLVFFSQSGAQELIRRSSAGEFVINNYIPKVVYNRIRTAPQPLGPESRVIHIEGPKRIVDQNVLRLFFESTIKFQTDEVLTLNEEPAINGRRRIEWRFGSYRCQAASAIAAIEKKRRSFPPSIGEESNLWRSVTTFYGVDPCAIKS